MKAAVRILAVKDHPTQGDLHNPMDPSVAFFHQRRALSHQEIALMPISTIRPYAGADTRLPRFSEESAIGANQISCRTWKHGPDALCRSLISCKKNIFHRPIRKLPDTISCRHCI